MIQVYTGDGRQTHFPPMGLSLRAAGHHMRTHISCFLPHEWMDAADMATRLLQPYLVIEHVEAEGSPPNGNWNKTTIHKMRQSLKRSREALKGGEFDIVVLNGIIEICSQGIISFV